MRKTELARKIARRAKLSDAAAADHLDRVLHRILKDLKKGRAVRLPGLGTLTPGRASGFRFTPLQDTGGAKKR